MKKVNFGDFEFDVNTNNYFNSDPILNNPCGAVVRASYITLYTAFNLVNADIYAPKVTEFFGVSDNPEMRDNAFAAIFLGAEYLLLGSYNYNRTKEKLKSLHDTFMFSADLASAIVGHACDLAIDPIAVAAVGDIFTIEI